MANTDQVVSYHYTFAFGDGTKKEFDIELDPVTLNCVQATGVTAPDWARLEYSKCENCPLDGAEAEFCPIAVGFAELVDFFKDIISYEEVEVSLTTDRRNISKHTSAQEGLSSLFGIYMVTNNCPVMEKLKPMVRYHLPFASVEETVYRASSMYLLGQYFRKSRGMSPDWDFRGLVELYENIRLVNKGISERLRSASNKDASVNAVIHLDVFAWMLPYSIEEALEPMKYLFSAYME